ncbi:hypothetical protein [Flavobacterium mekongense]|uniref:hypothetical protein n=1 Tax=Flavobacterium mekongense TaxID=3379707 RepID=UPI003999AE75
MLTRAKRLPKEIQVIPVKGLPWVIPVEEPCKAKTLTPLKKALVFCFQKMLTRAKRLPKEIQVNQLRDYLCDPSGGTLQRKTKGCCTALFFYFLKVLKSKLLALLENKKTFK